MSCERFSASLTDAACGETMADDLAAHLRGCDACRAALDEQRRLLAWADDELQEALAIEASADFTVRVMRQVGEHRDRAFNIGWWQMAAAAALALAVFGAWSLSRPANVPADGDRQPATAHLQPPVVEPPRVDPRPVQSVPREPRQSVRGTREARRTTRIQAAAPAAPEPEVLIPETQTRAIARIYQLTRYGAIDPDAPPAAPVAAELQIAPLVIPELVVRDIHSGGGSQ